jgi:hypothetical protein
MRREGRRGRKRIGREWDEREIRTEEGEEEERRT